MFGWFLVGDGWKDGVRVAGMSGGGVAGTGVGAGDCLIASAGAGDPWWVYASSSSLLSSVGTSMAGWLLLVFSLAGIVELSLG